MTDWAYDESARQYRNTETGKFMDATTRTEIRNDVLARNREETRKIAQALVDGKVTPAEYQRAMEKQIKQSSVANYAFGKGGRNNLDAADKAKIGDIVGKQYGYLKDFTSEIVAGTVSDDALLARSDMYANAGVSAHAYGQAAAYDIELPTMPGEQTCLSNCNCSWDIATTDDGGIEATWVLGASSASCDDCLSNADDYNPWTGE